jgi:hypothetical protein
MDIIKQIAEALVKAGALDSTTRIQNELVMHEIQFRDALDRYKMFTTASDEESRARLEISSVELFGTSFCVMLGIRDGSHYVTPAVKVFYQDGD